MFAHENTFYKAHQTEYRKKYFNKWLVIAGASLWGVYDTPKEAVENALKNFKPGEFMVHTPAHDNVVISIPSIWAVDPDENEEPEFTMTTSGDNLVKFTYGQQY